MTAARELIGNLIAGSSAFAGKVNLVNRNGGTCMGLPCEVSLQAIDDPGLVYLLTSTTGTAHALHELRGDPCAFVVYAESISDRIVANELTDWAVNRHIPVIGPQSAGVVIPEAQMIGWTGALPEPITAGEIAVVSQSGGMLSGFLRRTAQLGIGIHTAISYGTGEFTAGVDLALTLLDESGVGLLVLYAEALTPGELRQIGEKGATVAKPILLLNPGSSVAARAAVESHVGRAATSRDILRGMAEQFGFIVIPDAEDVMWAIEGITKLRYRRGYPEGIAVVATSGGAGAVTTDALSALGAPLCKLSEATCKKLEELGGAREIYNPYDLGASILDRGAAAYGQVVAAIASDPDVGIVVETSGTGLTFGVPGRGPMDASPERDFDRSGEFAEALNATGKVGLVSAPFVISRGVERRIEDVDLLAVTGSHRTAVICSALSQWTCIPSLPDAAIVVGEGVLSRARLRRGIWSGADLQTELISLRVHWPIYDIIHSMDEARVKSENLERRTLVAKTEAALAHRSSSGGVVTGILGGESLLAAFILLSTKFRAPVAFFESIDHDSEFLIGFTRREGGQFLVFGTGGVLAGQGAHLRACPCNPAEIARLVSFGGEMDQTEKLSLERLLADVQQYAMTRDEISSLELNPVAFDDRRILHALDAKMYVGE